jgi:nucleotide-binding universal stress UspA family protein
MNTVRSKAAIRKLNRATAVLDGTLVLYSPAANHCAISCVPWRERADLLVLGVLLGSVAEGALNRCPVPVVVARGDTA